MTSSSNFVTSIDIKLADRMIEDLDTQGFKISTPTHTCFSATKKGVSCTLYTSGKLVVQGKEKAEFIEFYLEPLLETFSFTYPQIKKAASQFIPEPKEREYFAAAHIGIDESGKGDYFGALCVAGVYTDKEGEAKLRALGIKDSKTLSDTTILKLAKAIRKEFVHHIVKINPQKYNELYTQFKNLNSLLAWAHATTIEQLSARTECQEVLIDQFANEHVVLNALKRKKLKLNIMQRHRAEEDLTVAAASILARETFLLSLEELSQKFCMKLPKGASKATLEAAREFVKKHGREALQYVAKLHFKTTLVVN